MLNSLLSSIVLSSPTLTTPVLIRFCLGSVSIKLSILICPPRSSAFMSRPRSSSSESSPRACPLRPTRRPRFLRKPGLSSLGEAIFFLAQVKRFLPVLLLLSLISHSLSLSSPSPIVALLGFRTDPNNDRARFRRLAFP